jgi:hypothetical protein
MKKSLLLGVAKLRVNVSAYAPKIDELASDPGGKGSVDATPSRSSG